MPTIKEVAEKASVSPTTVSHVINQTRFVSEDVRARVMAAMDELGYQPNALARSLRRGQTFTIGLILPDSANPFFAEIGHYIESDAFVSNYNVILCNTEGDLEKEKVYVDVLIKKQVDGIIFVAAGDRPDSLYPLLRRKLPVVLIDRNLPEIQEDIDSVFTNNYEGGYRITRHLLDLGHQRIGCIGGPTYLTPSAERLVGYRDALQEAGIAFDEKLIRRGDFHPESGRVAATQLLMQPAPPTAIFAFNDLMAIGVLRAASELGRRVPHDLAVVGFDDIELARFTAPALTTIAQPKMEMGKKAVELLVERMHNHDLPTRTELLPTKLIIRESCGAKR